MSKKEKILALMIENLRQELEVILTSARSARQAATHEESRAEDAHDTRGLEASYLAGAQAARAESLKKLIHVFQFSKLREFKAGDPIDAGAWVRLESDGGEFDYLLVAQGGGISVTFEGKSIQIITLQSPIGEALMGRKAGDAIEVEGQKQSREYEIRSVS